MPAHVLWERVVRLGKKRREQQENEDKKWVLEQLNFVRGVTFALQVNGELPPDPADLEKKRQAEKKGKQLPIPKAELNKARKQALAMREVHFTGISNAHDFCKYMGIPQLFDPPPPEALKTAKQITQEERAERRAQVEGIKSRLMGKLDKFIEKHGDTPIDQVLSRQPDEAL